MLADLRVCPVPVYSMYMDMRAITQLTAASLNVALPTRYTCWLTLSSQQLLWTLHFSPTNMMYCNATRTHKDSSDTVFSGLC